VDQLSIYLDCADSVALPSGWTRFAHFNLAVVNQYEPKMSVRKGILCFFQSSLAI
jgi:ubiquitin carboxyl-terminal hydrolase 7